MDPKEKIISSLNELKDLIHSELSIAKVDKIYASIRNFITCTVDSIDHDKENLKKKEQEIQQKTANARHVLKILKEASANEVYVNSVDDYICFFKQAKSKKLMCATIYDIEDIISTIKIKEINRSNSVSLAISTLEKAIHQNDTSLIDEVLDDLNMNELTKYCFNFEV